jgi:endoglucanase
MTSRFGTFLAVLCMLCALPSALQAQQEIRPPLHTASYDLLDAAGHRVRLTSVNWYGFDQKEFVAGGLDVAPLQTIIEQIRAIGANSVRLPWANETLEKNPVVPDYALKANPKFRGKRAMAVMDAVIDALARAHILIILDNHMSRADWCCKDDDGNGLWYNAEYPEEQWLADWRAIVRRYRKQRWVIGADLRNELRSGAQWGGTDPHLDWHAAAQRGGNAVLAENSNLLVMVEGPQYSTDFTAFASLPWCCRFRTVWFTRRTPTSSPGMCSKTMKNSSKRTICALVFCSTRNRRCRYGSANLAVAKRLIAATTVSGSAGSRGICGKKI